MEFPQLLDDAVRATADIQRRLSQIPDALIAATSTERYIRELDRTSRQLESFSHSPVQTALNHYRNVQLEVENFGTSRLLDDLRHRFESIEASSRGLIDLTRLQFSASSSLSAAATLRFPQIEMSALSAAFSSHAAAKSAFEQMQPWLDQVGTLVENAPDESTRRLTLQSIIEAVFEAGTGTNLDQIDSPKALLRFRLILICLVLSHLISYHQCQLQRAEISDLRQLQKQQAQTIALLTETVEELKEQATESPRIYLEAAEDGVMRDAPDGKAERIGRLKRGQVVRLVMIFKRWRYVELLDDNLHETGERGWIYRRAVSQLER